MYAPMSVIMEHHFVIASIYKQCMPIALWGQIKLKFKSENFINCHKKLPPGMCYCFQQRWSWSNSCYIYTAHCIVGQLGWKSQNNSRYNTIHDTLPMTTIVHCKTILKKNTSQYLSWHTVCTLSMSMCVIISMWTQPQPGKRLNYQNAERKDTTMAHNILHNLSVCQLSLHHKKWWRSESGKSNCQSNLFRAPACFNKTYQYLAPVYG